jgi:hypothetical protein
MALPGLTWLYICSFKSVSKQTWCGFWNLSYPNTSKTQGAGHCSWKINVGFTASCLSAHRGGCWKPEKQAIAGPDHVRGGVPAPAVVFTEVTSHSKPPTAQTHTKHDSTQITTLNCHSGVPDNGLHQCRGQPLSCVPW